MIPTHKTAGSVENDPPATFAVQSTTQWSADYRRANVTQQCLSRAFGGQQ
jgi:hypothetical protein